MPSSTIPGLASQVFSSGETVQVTTGTLQTLSAARYYYLVSSRAAASDGQSLLRALKDLLDASLAGTAWTVVLTKVGRLYKIQLSHNNGASRTITFSTSFAAALGFASTSFAVAASTTVTADYPSAWWWTPDMPISITGPEMFDPAISYGVPESLGASKLAPDMTAAYVFNGVTYSASFIFNGVQFRYKVRAETGRTNESLETWWQNGPQLGRRFLLWRDRDNATGSNAPSAGGSTPFRYVEYAPQDSLRASLPAVPTSPQDLVWWDVTLDCWVTPNLEIPYSA